MTPEQVAALCRDIIANWSRWEGEAMQEGQREQSVEAHDEEMLRQVRLTVQQHVGSAGRAIALGREIDAARKSFRACPKCGAEMHHTRLKGYRCSRCD